MRLSTLGSIYASPCIISSSGQAWSSLTKTDASHPYLGTEPHTGIWRGWLRAKLCPRRGRGIIKNPIPILVLVLISTPALAIDPAYLGVWAPSPQSCRAGDRTAFRFTPKGISGIELECETKQASSDGSSWLVRLWCGSEGTDS